MGEQKSNSVKDIENPDEDKREERINCVYLFNCDETYKLDAIEKMFEEIKPRLKAKLNLAVSTQCRYFTLTKMSEECENVIPNLKMDVAVFVVHAHESRLSINEDDAGIGYARFYRALLQATGEKVIIVIGGDDNYKNSIEEQSTVLSQWARRKVSSQFSEEYLDGRKSFIFSWDKEHRPIHEEALLHYFDPQKKDEKFVPEPKVEVTVSREDPEKQREEVLQQTTPSSGDQEAERQAAVPADEFPKSSEVGVKRSKTEANSSDTRTNTEALEGYNRFEQAFVEHLPQTNEEALSCMEIVQYPGKEHEEDKNMEESNEPFEELTHADVPVEDALPKPEPEKVQAMDTSPSTLQNVIAFLYRDQSDIANIKHLFGDYLSGMNTVTSSDPHHMKELLLSLNTPVRSCFLIVESIKLKEKMFTKSDKTVYEDLLETASRTVEKKIVVILCNQGKIVSSIEEEKITARIEKLLGEKGIIVWWKGNTKTSRPNRSIDVTDSTLVFKTRLHRGSISYDEKDVKVRLGGWTPPLEMAYGLLLEWHSTNVADLSVYRENKSGNESTVVTEDLETKLTGLGHSMKGVFGYVGLPGVGKKVADYSEVGASFVGAGARAGTSVIDTGKNIGASLAGVVGLASTESADSPPKGRSNTPPVNTGPEAPP